MKKGIDISSHNGDVDMIKVKNDGIEFIILRLGYGINIDNKFYENYNKCKKSGIPIGVYLYSYACDTNDAIKEADFVISIIEQIKLEYPIFIDMEDADGYKSRHHVKDSICINICETFCNYIEKKGYYAGIYANLDWLNNRINNKKLDRFDKWVAQWSNKCTYSKNYGIWQYSSKGKVNGIKGKVDLNYSLRDYPLIIKNNNLNNFHSHITYSVKDGDNLSKIAKKFNRNWKEIYELNKSVIGNDPNIIYVGQELIIEED